MSIMKSYFDRYVNVPAGVLNENQYLTDTQGHATQNQAYETVYGSLDFVHTGLSPTKYRWNIHNFVVIKL